MALRGGVDTEKRRTIRRRSKARRKGRSLPSLSKRTGSLMSVKAFTRALRKSP